MAERSPPPSVSLGPTTVSGGPGRPAARAANDLARTIGDALRSEALARGSLHVDRLSLRLPQGASRMEIERAIRAALDRSQRGPRR